MEQLNDTLITILEKKMNEIDNIVSTKKKNIKMIPKTDKDDINYSVKTTLNKIKAEEDRKLKSSKAYIKSNSIV